MTNHGGMHHAPTDRIWPLAGLFMDRTGVHFQWRAAVLCAVFVGKRQRVVMTEAQAYWLILAALCASFAFSVFAGKFIKAGW